MHIKSIKIFRFVQIVMLILPVILIEGCFVSDQPFYTDENKIPIPENIKGKWKRVMEDSSKPDEIWEFKESEIVTYQEDKIKYLVLPTYFKIDGTIFIDMDLSGCVGSDFPEGLHGLIKAELRDGSLWLWEYDNQKIIAKIKSGELKIEYIKPKEKGGTRYFRVGQEGWANILKKITDDEEIAYVSFKLRKLNNYIGITRRSTRPCPLRGPVE